MKLRGAKETTPSLQVNGSVFMTISLEGFSICLRESASSLSSSYVPMTNHEGLFGQNSMQLGGSSKRSESRTSIFEDMANVEQGSFWHTESVSKKNFLCTIMSGVEKKKIFDDGLVSRAAGRDIQEEKSVVTLKPQCINGCTATNSIASATYSRTNY